MDTLAYEQSLCQVWTPLNIYYAHPRWLEVMV